jgi:hypothetical protein
MSAAMNRCAATLPVAFVLLALSVPGVRAGPVEVLLDPHAGSAEKYDAVKKLSEAGPAAIDAAPALARQSKYDQPHIRALALQTLVRLVGEKEAERLRAQDDRRTGDDVAQRWLDSAKTWEQLPKAALFFHNARPEFQRAAAIAAIRIWDNTHTIPRKTIGFDDQARRDYAAALSNLMPVLSEAGIRSATELTLALRNPEPEATPGSETAPGPEAVPTLLTALASEDPKTRDVARKGADQVFKPNPGDRKAFARVIAGIVNVLVQPNPSTRLVAVAMGRLMDMGDGAKAIAVDLALYHVALGHSRANALIESWNADRTPFARAVIEQASNIPEYYRVRFAALIQSLSAGPDEAAGVAARLICDGDEPFRARIATLIDAAR